MKKRRTAMRWRSRLAWRDWLRARKRSRRSASIDEIRSHVRDLWPAAEVLLAKGTGFAALALSGFFGPGYAPASYPAFTAYSVSITMPVDFDAQPPERVPIVDTFDNTSPAASGAKVRVQKEVEIRYRTEAL